MAEIIDGREMPKMDLGAFSVSLAVRDLAASMEFYAKLGFELFHGDVAQKWVILKNGDCTIGLFQDMFDKNILTFNPGWDANATPLPTFADVRELQKMLKVKGVFPVKEADEAGSGPASMLLVDPDGNPVLIDQHV